jgi:hypothetical protein
MSVGVTEDYYVCSSEESSSLFEMKGGKKMGGEKKNYSYGRGRKRKDEHDIDLAGLRRDMASIPGGEYLLFPTGLSLQHASFRVFLFLFLTIHCWITSAIASNADIAGRTKVDVVVKTKMANAAAIVGRTRAITDFARKQELYILPPPLSSVRSRKIILNNNVPCNLIAEMCVLAFFSPDLTNGALNFPPPFRQRPGELQLI